VLSPTRGRRRDREASGRTFFVSHGPLYALGLKSILEDYETLDAHGVRRLGGPAPIRQGKNSREVATLRVATACYETVQRALHTLRF
jgi:hypothetical protein